MTDRSRSPRFVEGGLYSYAEIRDYTFMPGELHDHSHPVIDPRTLFRCTGDDFIEVVEPEDPLIPSTEAQRLVEGILERGLTYREVARLAGVSLESVYRCASGVGRVRTSTEVALAEVAASLNGKPE